MSATIQILQKDKQAGVMDSYIIDIETIAELHCRYPVSEDKDEEQNPQEPDDTEYDFSKPDPELNILYMNGDRRTITIAVPTSFLIYHGGEMVCKTANMQEFETAYLSVSLGDYEADESSE